MKIKEEELKEEKVFDFKNYGDSGRQDLKMTINKDGAIHFSDMNISDGGFVYFYPKNARKLLKILSKEGFQEGKSLALKEVKEKIEKIDMTCFEGEEYGDTSCIVIKKWKKELLSSLEEKEISSEEDLK